MKRIALLSSLVFSIWTASGLPAASIAPEAYLKASNPDAGDNFGRSVAVSGDTVAVAAFNENSSSTGVNGNAADNSASQAGAVYVFVRSGSTWTQQAYLKASNTGAGDGFGESIAISGDTIVVTAPFEASNAAGVNGNSGDNSASSAGAAYVFVRAGGVWSQQAYLKASNPGASDRFGESVAISGDTIVVGSTGEDSSSSGVNGDGGNNALVDSGAAYVFVRNGGAWSQQAYLKASNPGASDSFGGAVGISGDTIVVGANAERSSTTGVNGGTNDSAFQAGAAYVFTRAGGSWTQQAFLKASNTDSGDRFGPENAVSGDTVVVGANGEDSATTGVGGNQADNSAPGSGAAYVFVRSGGLWTQQAYLKASNTGAGDNFGFPVALDGDLLGVGAVAEDSAATGIDGNAADNTASDAGAAYLFSRTGGSWAPRAYLKASNTDSGDGFGPVNVSGRTVVTGAAFEDSNATGVDSDGANNSAGSSGAAYVFVDPAPGATPVPAPPTVRVQTRKSFSTTRARVTVRGTATDAARVEFKAGRQKFRPAAGSPAAWHFQVALQPGRNAVTVRAQGPGGTSAGVPLKITRRD